MSITGAKEEYNKYGYQFKQAWTEYCRAQVWSALTALLIFLGLN